MCAFKNESYWYFKLTKFKFCEVPIFSTQTNKRNQTFPRVTESHFVYCCIDIV